jgi:hypothetical protein
MNFKSWTALLGGGVLLWLKPPAPSGVKAATSLSCFLEAFDNQVKKYLKDHEE